MLYIVQPLSILHDTALSSEQIMNKYSIQWDLMAIAPLHGYLIALMYIEAIE